MSSPTRPLLRWHGGKWRLAPWIIGHFPEHRTYVEPFGGGASVLMRKDPCYSEVYNDLDEEIVNLFRVLRSERADELVQQVARTAFARAEFEEAYLPCSDSVERARRLLVRTSMGYGSGLAAAKRSTGFRSDSKKSGSTPAHNWQGFPPHLSSIIQRLRGVVIESRPALDVMKTHDSPGTLHYVDPPYVHDTRSSKRSNGYLHHRYAVEMTDDDHVELLEALQQIRGKVILSGYPHQLYDQALSGWHRAERAARADRARPRMEVLWMNFDPAATPPPGGIFHLSSEEAA